MYMKDGRKYPGSHGYRNTNAITELAQKLIYTQSATHKARWSSLRRGINTVSVENGFGLKTYLVCI